MLSRMNRIVGLFLLMCVVSSFFNAHGAEGIGRGNVVLKENNRSLQNEIQHSIDRGLAWLLANQDTNGWWQTADYPAVTGLVLSAFNGDPMDRYRGGKTPAALKKAYGYLLSMAKADGGIFATNLPTYNTAISMMALLSANEPRYESAARNARKFLVSIQNDFGEKGVVDTPFDGGFGYGLPSDKVSDMSNTLLALEAIHASKRLVADRSPAEGKDLNWAAAIHFLESCQNLPSHNKQGWASDDSTNRGGFIYHTGRSNAGSETNAATGKVTWRSYGSISYAGMLSYIYADLRPDDPRVKAVAEWLQKNYTLEENPGMGAAGLYFYYHTMAKALSLASMLDPKLIGEKQSNWRQELALKVMDLQQKDGSWVNTNVRWWEKEPALVTAYAVFTLETIWRALEK
jgi:squalene-hopene/tetraprenyl-beta-curcumene cyclase